MPQSCEGNDERLNNEMMMPPWEVSCTKRNMSELSNDEWWRDRCKKKWIDEMNTIDNEIWRNMYSKCFIILAYEEQPYIDIVMDVMH